MTPRKPVLTLAGLYFVLALQVFGTLTFVADLWSDVLGLRGWTVPWRIQEYIQILASIALILGTITGVALIRRSQSELRRMSTQIEAISGQFHDHVVKQFDHWGLSPSEHDIAIYAMKGLSNQEIADLRGTSAATVKSQMNAIYKKAGLANRQQLISFLVEDMLNAVGNDQR